MPHSDLEAARRALRDLTDAPRPVCRSIFNGWDATRQSLFCRAGGTITPDPKPPRRGSAPVAVPKMTRADFLRADAADRARTIR